MRPADFTNSSMLSSSYVVGALPRPIQKNTCSKIVTMFIFVFLVCFHSFSSSETPAYVFNTVEAIQFSRLTSDLKRLLITWGLFSRFQETQRAGTRPVEYMDK